MAESDTGPSTWDKLRRWLKGEKAELDDALRDAEVRGNAALDAKERELHATPEERLRLEQERAQQADEEYEALKRKLEGG
jgi:hypothetical protein